MTIEIIDEVLQARKDISPFLVHLTRDIDGECAKDNLKKILKDKKLQRGKELSSTLKTIILGTESCPGIPRQKHNLNENDLKKRNSDIEATCRYVSFTETPLDQIHCLIDIKRKQINLTSYGVVLLKNFLQKGQNFNPVFYLNTYQSTDFAKYILETIWRFSFCDHIPDNITHSEQMSKFFKPKELLKLLAFTECFGRSFDEERSEPIDFYWEREWRSLCDVDLNFNSNLEEVNVFVGLCNHEAIQEMENEFNIPFIDPMKNLYIYSAKLKKRSKDLKLENTIL